MADCGLRIADCGLWIADLEKADKAGSLEGMAQGTCRMANGEWRM
jgi:hypothetical protein